MPTPRIGRPARKIDPRTLGGKIRRARLALDWTAAELATRSGCSLRTVQRIESEGHEPPLETLLALARALGLKPGSLDSRLG